MNIERRHLLTRTAYAAALFGLPIETEANAAPALPDTKLLDRDPEAYWALIRKEQFLLPEWRAFLNCGTLGVAPKPVLEAVTNYLYRAAALDVEELQAPQWGFQTLDEIRQELSEFLGCRKEELALTHNTTTGMNIVANGLDLNPGDEVVITDQEHPSGIHCWLQKQARIGISVREAKIPIPPKSPEEVTEALISAIGPRTRVLSFSGIAYTTGLILPIRQISEAARDKGVITVVDAAHLCGQVPINLHELGCDFFASSPHKWMLAPAGCGILYGRDDMLNRLWANVATSSWAKTDIAGARHQMIGTNNMAIFEGYGAALRFLKQLGPENVYSRIHQLATKTFQRVRALPYLEKVLSADDDRMYAGMVSFLFKEGDWQKVEELVKKRKIWIFARHRTRISTHIHTRLSDLDLFFEAVEDALGRGKKA